MMLITLARRLAEHLSSAGRGLQSSRLKSANVDRVAERRRSRFPRRDSARAWPPGTCLRSRRNHREARRAMRGIRPPTWRSVAPLFPHVAFKRHRQRLESRTEHRVVAALVRAPGSPGGTPVPSRRCAAGYSHRCSRLVVGAQWRARGRSVEIIRRAPSSAVRARPPSMSIFTNVGGIRRAHHPARHALNRRVAVEPPRLP